MLAGLSYSTLADAAFAHPTMAEGLSLLFANVRPRATVAGPRQSRRPASTLIHLQRSEGLAYWTTSSSGALKLFTHRDIGGFPYFSNSTTD